MYKYAATGFAAIASTFFFPRLIELLVLGAGAAVLAKVKEHQ